MLVLANLMFKQKFDLEVFDMCRKSRIDLGKFPQKFRLRGRVAVTIQ